MERYEIIIPEREVIVPQEASKPFIEANTVPCSLEEMKMDHIIPVFVRDNEPLISHSEFIQLVQDKAADLFHGERILSPEIRVSHPVKGRVPEAKDKPANELLPWEKTLYYERMAFAIEIPSIQSTVDGNALSLTIGGVKSYAQDNLYSRNQSEQHFKVFIGFKNTICTNLCVWTDGFMDDLRVKNTDQLQLGIRTLLESYNSSFHLHHLGKLADYALTEQQFAVLMGRSRMYTYLPQELKREIKPLQLTDTQMGAVVKDYYQDTSFCRDEKGDINLWRVYNLFTGVNKSSYIDQYLERGINAFEFVEQVRWSLEGKEGNWFLQ